MRHMCAIHTRAMHVTMASTPVSVCRTPQHARAPAHARTCTLHCKIDLPGRQLEGHHRSVPPRTNGFWCMHCGGGLLQSKTRGRVQMETLPRPQPWPKVMLMLAPAPYSNGRGPLANPGGHKPVGVHLGAVATEGTIAPYCTYNSRSHGHQRILHPPSSPFCFPLLHDTTSPRIGTASLTDFHSFEYHAASPLPLFARPNTAPSLCPQRRASQNQTQPPAHRSPPGRHWGSPATRQPFVAHHPSVTLQRPSALGCRAVLNTTKKK